MPSPPKSILALLLLCCGFAFRADTPNPASGALPDLDVAWVSLEPRYPAYLVEYPDGVPQEIDPNTGKPLSLDESRKIHRSPRSGEVVTATARVVNHGAAPTGTFTFIWLVDGKRVQSGTHAALEADCTATAQATPWRVRGKSFREALLRPKTFADLTFSFKWPKKGRRLEFRVKPQTGDDLVIENSSRLELGDAWSMAVVVHRRQYNAFTQVKGPLGTRSFEDWVQHQADLLRGKMDQSTYPTAAGGVRTSFRIDTIRVLEDTEDLRAFGDVARMSGWDTFWAYGDERDPAADAARNDWSVVKQWGRLLGLVDLNGFDVAPEANGVRDPATGARTGMGYVWPDRDPMRIPEDVPFSEWSVLALNAGAGKRRGFDGIWLYELPRECQVRVLDNNGRNVEGAEVTVYQSEARQIPDRPIAQGKTDRDGVFSLPNRQAIHVRTDAGPELRDNPFGTIQRDGSNGVLFIRIAAKGQTEYQWLPITAFNVAYWHGQTTLATFDLRTRIPSGSKLSAPRELAARVLPEEDRDVVSLSWKAPAAPGVVGYFVYRATYPAFQWERAGGVTAQRTTFADPADASQFAGPEARYAVSAIDVEGNESALSSPAVVRLSGMQESAPGSARM